MTKSDQEYYYLTIGGFIIEIFFCHFCVQLHIEFWHIIKESSQKQRQIHAVVTVPAPGLVRPMRIGGAHNNEGIKLSVFYVKRKLKCPTSREIEMSYLANF